jgi:hypothetical protein
LKNNWIDSSAPSSYTSGAWNSINTVILAVIVCHCFARLKSIDISSSAVSVLIVRSSGISSQRLYFGLYIFIFHNIFNSTAIHLVLHIISSTTEAFSAQRYEAEGRVFCHQPSCHICFTHCDHFHICGCQNFALAMLTVDDLSRSGLITIGQARHCTGQYSLMFY